MMLEPHTAALVDYFEAFLRDQDVAAFRRSVLARYTDGTLARLVRSGGTQARRAAVLALGLNGTFDANPVVAAALRDPDPTVRDLAQQRPSGHLVLRRQPRAQRDAPGGPRSQRPPAPSGGLRPGHPAGRPLSPVRRGIQSSAIAAFFLDRLPDSEADCLRTLERNPYHTGALSGLGQCYIRMGRLCRGVEDLPSGLETPALQPGTPRDRLRPGRSR